MLPEPPDVPVLPADPDPDPPPARVVEVAPERLAHWVLNVQTGRWRRVPAPG